jgi:copper transport outer membrane protein MctB
VTGLRHVTLAVVAAVLALALGLALGAGPVVSRSDASRSTRDSTLRARNDRLHARVTALEAGARTDARVVAAFSGPLTRGRLDGHSVLLVRTPGATAELVRRTRAALLGAGASLTGQLTITGDYLDPAKAAAPLEDLALRLVPPKVTFPSASTPIQRVGTVLARSTVSAKPPDEPDQDGAEVIAGLDELGALRLDGEPGRLAQLAVVVTGATMPPGAKPALLALVSALDAGGSGALVTGPGPDAPAVGWARSGGIGGASSVDTADTPAGQAAVVLGLVEQLHGAKGAYGSGPGASAVLPASTLTAAVLSKAAGG